MHHTTLAAGLQDQPAPDAVPHDRPDTSLRAELLGKLATQREVILSLCDRVDRLEMRADGLTAMERVERRWAKEADGPAVPDDREPASVAREPSDAELLELMPQQFRDDLATVSRMAAHNAGAGVTAGLFRVTLNTGALEYARAVLARWGRQPAPLVEGEVGELADRLGRIADGVRDMGWEQDAGTITRAAKLLQQRHPAPVPVAEREVGEPSDENCWQWYTYCPEEGLEMYSDRKEAQSAAQSIMGSYEVAAHSDGWHEDMESVSWGMLVPVEQAQVVERRTAEPGGEFDEWVKYELRPARWGRQPEPVPVAPEAPA